MVNNNSLVLVERETLSEADDNSPLIAYSHPATYYSRHSSNGQKL